jgi:hypothetical protein
MTITPLRIIINTIKTRRTQIGFDDTGTELATSVKKMAYARSIVIPNDTLSPDSIGSMNAMGFIRVNNIVGKITITMLYNGRRLIESSRTNVRDISISRIYCLYEISSQSEVGMKYVNSDLSETRVVFTSIFDTPHIPNRNSHVWTSNGNFEISVRHLAFITPPGFQ